MQTTLTYITSALSSGQKRELRRCGDVSLLLEISGRGPLKIQRENSIQFQAAWPSNRLPE